MSGQEYRPLWPVALAMAAFALAMAALGATVAAQPSTDAFYEQQLQEGIAARHRGETSDAAKRLRVACFGLLDSPPTLATCLVHLALAHGGADNNAGVGAAFTRLMAIEDRFQAYSTATLDPEVRREFEELIVDRVPPQQLRGRTGFDRAARRLALSDLERLPPNEQTARLENWAQSEPKEAEWPLRIARLEHGRGNRRTALSWADEALQRSPQNQEAQCLRRDLLAAERRCSEALEDTEHCPAPETVASIRGLFECFTRQEDWTRAAELLGSLGPDLRSNSRIRRLTKSLPTPSDGEVAGLSAAEKSDLEEASRLLSDTDRDELERARELIEPISAAHPHHPDTAVLAGRIMYRLSRFGEAVGYLQPVEPVLEDQPLLLFYYAVALYESGRQEEAAAVLERALPRLKRTDFVREYVAKVLESDASGQPVAGQVGLH